MCISMRSVCDHLDKPTTATMSFQFTIQMQPLAGLPCEKKPHLQSVPLERRSLVLACVPRWMYECQALPSSLFFLRLSSGADLGLTALQTS
ncbi:hypothetical protein PDJAM_G00057430 [Pangasius djambal]|uniref:Uncharacterized protein n=1 Tax=Pangasius djambal TaxID=1691987 RepID=A0ACC5YXR4_9TELE|nr:hypothetical protein [Pangasius djambal]